MSEKSLEDIYDDAGLDADGTVPTWDVEERLKRHSKALKAVASHARATDPVKEEMGKELLKTKGLLSEAWHAVACAMSMCDEICHHDSPSFHVWKHRYAFGTLYSADKKITAYENEKQQEGRI